MQSVQGHVKNGRVDVSGVKEGGNLWVEMAIVLMAMARRVGCGAGWRTVCACAEPTRERE